MDYRISRIKTGSVYIFPKIASCHRVSNIPHPSFIAIDAKEHYLKTTDRYCHNLLKILSPTIGC